MSLLTQWQRGKRLRGSTILGLVQAETNTPYRAMESIVKAVQSADSTSPILRDISLAKTKIFYLTTFGIGQFQKRKWSRKCCKVKLSQFMWTVQHSVKSSSKEETWQKNLNIISTFFWEPTRRVETHFLDTVFLTDDKATTQLEQIKASLDDCQEGLEKVSQLSRDNPAVNHKLLKD